MAEIAGHTFVYGVCACGVRWIDIRYADESAFHDDYAPDHDNPDKRWKKWAHAGKLNAEELRQIRDEVVAEEKRFSDALYDIGRHP